MQIIGLLLNSELTKGNYMHDADALTVCLQRKTLADMRYDLVTLTLLFVVRNIMCWYCFFS